MKLDTEFIRLPLDFDVERLQAEILAVPEEAWQPHPQGNPGNWGLPLVAVRGNPADDSTKGPMAPTPNLAPLAYVQQVLASFSTVVGRTRLMRLDGNTEATLHVDINYYWAERVRIHVPIVTSPAIQFTCGDRAVHMAAGESWIFDASRMHNVLNTTGDRRIHLVADTVGSAQFWDLVKRGRRPFSDTTVADVEPVLVPHRPGAAVRLGFEQSNFPSVMTPWEQNVLTRDVLADLAPGGDGTQDDLARFAGATNAFLQQWRALWARYGDSAEGWAGYQALLEAYGRGIEPTKGRLRLPNGMDAVNIAHQTLIVPALNPDLSSTAPPSGGSAPVQPAPVQRAPVQPAPLVRPSSADAQRRERRFDRPVFIVAPPRSGTSLLFETLALSPDLWSIGEESHQVIEQIQPLHPASRGWDSNRLDPSDARPAVVAALEDGLWSRLRDRYGRPPEPDATGLRLLEKTPKNCLRIPFLNAVFPDARFVYVQRDPRESLSSMIAAWESGRFVTYPDLPGWEGKPWSLLLTPEWRKLIGSELPEIVAEQWRMATELAISELERLPAERWGVVSYHRLVAEPRAEIERLCEFLEIEWDQDLDDELPLSRHTLTPPRPDKWRQHAEALARVEQHTANAAHRSRDLLARPLQLRTKIGEVRSTEESPYRSSASASLPDLLRQIGGTVLASTYQTGKLVALRHADGMLNTHFYGMEAPMGLAYRGGRLAVGSRGQVWEYHNVPAVAARLEPQGRFDGCLVPRRAVYTGDIRVHDVAWVGDELWVVATRFSCLATIDGEHSFVPQWRPPFITGLAAEDRCHLNGLAVVDDEIRYVTALGVSDEPEGWRDSKADGGVIIDVRSGEVAVGGLSMPHSPRWHRDRLWVLESGQGTLATVDLATGTVETVVELPGFTRGLAFAGRYAFVGLSEVREALTFGGLPLTGRLEERECGVWAVDIETGSVVAFLRFEDLVQEIYDVCLLPGLRFPEFAEHGTDAVNSAFVVPDEALAAPTT